MTIDVFLFSNSLSLIVLVTLPIFIDTLTQLSMFNCYSNWFTCITNVVNIGVPFADLFGLVYNIYNLTYRGYDEFDNRTYEELLSYLCNNVTTGRLLFFLVF